ncbi:MAG: nucleotidyltransferase family protein [Chloroflexi bacterium]|nr:nucleotidyltransferase family protein [Chloroflexota bacterium]
MDISSPTISPPLSKTNIIALLQAHGPEIRAFGVRRLGLFGSFVRNEAREGSDIDILVEFEPERKNLDNLVGLGDYLEALFRHPVELVTPEALSPYIGPHILAEVEYVSFTD